MFFEEIKRGIGNTDIYLLDQILKGRIQKGDRVLDAGCGGGRNLKLLLDNNFEFAAFDSNKTRIELLKKKFPKHNNSFHQSSIEDFQCDVKFNFIICNAVLHFADNHKHFQVMFGSLVDLLTPKGILFIRMTSNIGIENTVKEIEQGVHEIPDGSIRYLLTRPLLERLIIEHQLEFIDPFKTVNVDDKRCMSTLVLRKK